MKVLLTKLAYLHEDLGFEHHICEFIDFYSDLNVFSDCIFTRVLRHVKIIVKMYGFHSFSRPRDQYLTKSSKITYVLAHPKTTIKQGCFNMQ